MRDVISLAHLALLCATAAPSLSSAQVTDSLLLAQLKNGMFPPRQASSIDSALRDAASRRLPTALIANKVREAAARNADGTEVLADINAWVRALLDARDAVGAPTNANVLERTAVLIRAGMPVASIRSFRRARPSSGVPVPLTAAMELVQLGVPVDPLSRGLLTLVDRGASDEQFLMLVLNVARSTYGGTPAAIAYLSALNAMLAARSGGG